MRAAYRFGYIVGWNGYTASSDTMEILPHPITNGYENVSFTSSKVVGVFKRRIKKGEEIMRNGRLIPEFIVEPFDKHGRYAFVGWVYQTPISRMSDDEKELLLRTIRWVQCGNPESC